MTSCQRRPRSSWVGDGLAAGARVVWAEPPDGSLRDDLERDGVGWRAAVRTGQLATVLRHRVEDFVLAVSEAVTNSLRHGGGAGRIRVWRDNGAVVAEVRDSGKITDPLIGRTLPAGEATNGRGLWIANQVCDLVQLRSGDLGTAVRLHMRA